MVRTTSREEKPTWLRIDVNLLEFGKPLRIKKEVLGYAK